MTVQATVRITWNSLNDRANRVMEDAFNRSNPFEYVTGQRHEDPKMRNLEWGVPFEPDAVICQEPGFVEFDLEYGAPTQVFFDLASCAPDNTDFRMYCLTDAGGLTADGYFIGDDGELRNVSAPDEFAGTKDEAWERLEAATNRYAELEAEGALA